MDEELITYILTKKKLDNTFYGCVIAKADLNKCEPWDLLGTSVWCITIIRYYMIHNFNNIFFNFLLLQEKGTWYCKYYDITHVQQKLKLERRNGTSSTIGVTISIWQALKPMASWRLDIGNPLEGIERPFQLTIIYID